MDEILVRHCAPTLAGIKPASLFNYKTKDPQELHRHIERWNNELSHHGLKAHVLKHCPKRHVYLVYFCRVKWITTILNRVDVKRFLQNMGYEPAIKYEDALTQLSKRLSVNADFPHEIGIFLGYPLEDVEGFIINGGKNYTYCGYWKVYGDPAPAMKRFRMYRACIREYIRRFECGSTILQLAVAV